MRLRYAPLLSLRVSHAWSEGAPCDAVGFVIPDETVRTLRNARMVTRAREGTLEVFFEADSSGAPVTWPREGALRFGLVARDPALFNYTAPSSLPGAGMARWYRGAPDGSFTAPAEVPLVGAVFAHALATSERPVTVVALGPSGQARQTVEVTDPTQTQATLRVDRYDPGPLSLVESGPGGSAPAGTVYQHPRLVREGAFAIVDIDLGAAPAGTSREFVVALDARRGRLRYYVTAPDETEAEFNRLAVIDGEGGRLTFTRTPGSAFGPTELPASLFGPNASRVALFESQEEVPRRRSPMKRIQLWRSATVLFEHLPQPGPDRSDAKRNGTVLIEHLPQPGPDRSDANIIVRISK